MIVKQRATYDCVLAVLAMASGKPYEEMFDPAFCQIVEQATKCSGDNLDEAYKRAGFINGENMWIVYFGNNEPRLARQMLMGRRAMIQVPSLNHEGAEHMIYWDGRQILDPSNKQVYKYLQHVFPTYVTIFNEVSCSKT